MSHATVPLPATDDCLGDRPNHGGWHAAFDLPSQPLDREAGPRRRGVFMQPPCEWLLAERPQDVAEVLDRAHERARAGFWVIGGLRYEAAIGLMPHEAATHPLSPGTPLAEWAVFDSAPCEWPEAPAAATLPTQRTTPWQCSADEPWAHQAIEHIREAIRRGEVYQINLTMPLQAELQAGCTPQDLFLALSAQQPGGFAFFLRRGPQAWLSLSPELFFAWAPAQQLRLPPGAPPLPPSATAAPATAWRLATQPMKGTSARHPEPDADAAARQHLLDSPKERAENLMIVDLLRNDLSQVALTGTVQVPALFELHALTTVWQMTSTVTCLTPAALRLSEVFKALFPCGSITGAPKRAAMQLIHALEPQPRGLYCGALGWMEPGGACLFNVPIRTVEADGRRLKAGVGSGITLDAEPAPEWQEWQAKVRFLRKAESLPLPLDTARVQDGQVWLAATHRERLLRALACFDPPADLAREGAALDQAWQQALADGGQRGSWRLRTQWTGERWQVERLPLPAPHAAEGLLRLRVALAPSPAHWWPDLALHKTHRREHLPPPPPDAFDWVLHDPQGRLLEGSFGHLAVCLEGRWLTPRLGLGVLDGTYRRHLLAHGVLSECAAGEDLCLHHLAQAQGLAWFNSLRGWWPARLADR